MGSAAVRTIELEHVEAGVSAVYLNRPAARNAFTADMWVALGAAIAEIASTPTSRALVIAARGPFFSAGGDLKTPPESGTRALRAAGRLRLAHQVFAEIRRLPIPVIAAVHGGAVGLGWGLCLSCDLVVAHKDAFFSAPFVRRGLVPDGGIGWYLTRRLGSVRASELLLSGRRLSAPEAHSLGLVSSMVDGAADGAAVQQARDVLLGSPDAIEQAKRLIRHAESTSLEEYLDLEAVSAALGQGSRDAREGRQAFEERRRPAW